MANLYDNGILNLDKYTGHQQISKKINSLFPNDKEIKILDYGCGTGLVAEYLENIILQILMVLIVIKIY